MLGTVLRLSFLIYSSRVLWERYCFVIAQLFSCVWLFVTPWTAAYQALLSSTISQSFLKFTSIESVMLFNHLFLCSPPTPNFSQHQGLFQCVGSSHQVASASASVLPMNIQGWFPLGLTGLTRTARRPNSQEFSPAPQFEASVFWCSAFYMVQLSHPYMPTEKNIPLDFCQ